MPEHGDESVHDIERTIAGATHIVVWNRNRDQSDRSLFWLESVQSRTF